MRRIYLFCCLVCLGLSGLAQDPDAEDRKIGLVLSGGGAKGMAHIGALKVIEEAGVEIDYIGEPAWGPL